MPSARKFFFTHGAPESPYKAIEIISVALHLSILYTSLFSRSSRFTIPWTRNFAVQLFSNATNGSYVILILFLKYCESIYRDFAL